MRPVLQGIHDGRHPVLQGIHDGSVCTLVLAWCSATCSALTCVCGGGGEEAGCCTLLVDRTLLGCLSWVTLLTYQLMG